MNRWRQSCRLGLALVIALVAAGCASNRKPVPRETVTVLRITQHVGGAHYRTLVHQGRWYQTFGTELLVLDPRSARVLHRVELGRIGESGPAIDLAVHDDYLYAVIEDEAVIELSIAAGRSPRITDEFSAARLGIRPRRLAVIDDVLYVSGEGGVAVPGVPGLGRIFEAEGDVSRVAPSEEGPVACIGRRTHLLEDGRFVGSASELIEAGSDLPGALVFARQSDQGALVGLMGADLRELDARRLTVAVPGTVRSLRVINDEIWVVTDTEVLAYVAYNDHLVRLKLIDVLGARDVARLDENHLAIAGTFGRTVYRTHATERGSAETFHFTHREPSRLSKARTDGRYVLAGSGEGAWLYHIGSRVELSDQPFDPGAAPAPPRRAATVDAEAEISGDGLTLTLKAPAGTAVHREPRGVMHTVIASEGDFWIGHDLGITILRDRVDVSPESPARVLEAGRLRLDGPVRYLYPGRVGGGAVFVAEYGGFGIARFIHEPK